MTSTKGGGMRCPHKQTKADEGVWPIWTSTLPILKNILDEMHLKLKWGRYRSTTKLDIQMVGNGKFR